MARDKSRNGSGAQENSGESEGIAPKYRRSFGCVTWIYMATLAFLAMAFIALAPALIVARFFLPEGSFGTVLSVWEGLSLVGLLAIVPAMGLAAYVGAKTYRIEKKQATRIGTWVGLVVGWILFFTQAWLGRMVPPVSSGDQPSSETIFSYWQQLDIATYIFAPLMFVASVLILYSLIATAAENTKRKRLFLIGTAISLIPGLALLLSDFDLLGFVGVAVACVSGAAGGWTAGIGYARAGGAEMLPPGVTEKPRTRRGKGRKPRGSEG